MGIERVLLFYNPHAGNGLFKANLDMIIDKFQKNKMLIVPVRADKKSLLDKIFHNFNVNEYKKIIAAGGDGTINTVVNAMVRNDIDVPLAIFPSGTANDFAYYFDIPNDIDGMVEIALHDNYTYSDIGKAGEKCFINVMAMGMLVDVSQKTDPQVKSTLGIVSYYLKGMAELPKLKPIPIKVFSEEKEIDTKMYFLIIMNGRSAGGFKKISPTSEVNDGKLDVMIFEAMNALDFPALLVGVLSGKHKKNKNVIAFQTSKLRIESSREVVVDLDGEKGGVLPLEVELIPKRLRINTLVENMEGSNW